eukprot:4424930-Pyramimonas_sp.AAC.1
MGFFNKSLRAEELWAVSLQEAGKGTEDIIAAAVSEAARAVGKIAGPISGSKTGWAWTAKNSTASSNTLAAANTSRHTESRGNEILTLEKATRVVAVLQESFHGDNKIVTVRKYKKLMATQCREKCLPVLPHHPDVTYKE